MRVVRSAGRGSAGRRALHGDHHRGFALATENRSSNVGPVLRRVVVGQLGGGVRAHLNMDLRQTGPAETEMQVTLEAHLLGKIGEFGQPVIRKKADAMLQEFAANVGRRLLEA